MRISHTAIGTTMIHNQVVELNSRTSGASERCLKENTDSSASGIPVGISPRALSVAVPAGDSRPGREKTELSDRFKVLLFSLLISKNENDCCFLSKFWTRKMSFNIKEKSISIFIGPMKAAKTTRAIQMAQKYSLFCKVMYVNPKVDIRSSDGVVRSRNGLNSTCVSVVNLSELTSCQNFQEADVIVLDEAQFYPDLKNFVIDHKGRKTFIISSLDADYKQEKFGQVWDLIPYAQTVEKLLALCELCKDGTHAVCTISTMPLEGQVHVVSAEKNEENPDWRDCFIPVCLKHQIQGLSN
jgi:thymidine kinase